MKTILTLAVVLVAAVAVPLNAGEIRGQYVEARTCDVWTGACFANAEMHIAGKHALMAWKIEKGSEGDVNLDGLSIVAVIETEQTLGQHESSDGKAVLIVDKNATAAQREALVRLARKLSGKLTAKVVHVETAAIQVSVNNCKEGGCALVDAGIAGVTTRCIHEDEDAVCGHEDNFYPPLSQGVRARSAMVTKHEFTGKGFDKNWRDTFRRGAYVGSFSVK
jgi:hypothetical protein